MADPKNKVLVSIGAALLGVVGGAAPTGLLVHDAEAKAVQPFVRRRDDDQDREEPLLLIAPEHMGTMLLAGHSSHRSHSSHYSGNSHYSGGGGRTFYVPDTSVEPQNVKPPKPATVSFIAYPGGNIFVDGKSFGRDTTRTLKLSAGKHSIRVQNRFLGEGSVEVELTEGQKGVVEINWHTGDQS